MALTTNGKLTVAHSIRVGYGESDITIPGETYTLDVEGDIYTDDLIVGGYIKGNSQFYGTNTGGSYADAPIEIREVNLVGSGQTADAYAPALAFH